MAKSSTPPPGAEYVEPLRAATEQSIQHARKAFDEMMSVAHKSVASVEANTSTVHGKLRDMGRDTLEFTEATVDASFSLVEAMSRAQSPQEVLELQQKFMQQQMERFGAQARSAGESAVKAAQDLTKPFER
ncbi:phasin family protein [Methylobrevis albus]|uniref:Phasin family protein n=1 Tax=Methylobrevis albus TaxID=2793297 RepID=A0A931I161_9HYPH|nr:phasin family protein [Methylobrevis albus]MBH0238290.1 phasin family protein [Methylobrevis albus]